MPREASSQSKYEELLWRYHWACTVLWENVESLRFGEVRMKFEKGRIVDVYEGRRRQPSDDEEPPP